MKRPFIITIILGIIGYSGYGVGVLLFVSVILPLAVLLSPFAKASKVFIRNVLYIYIYFLTRIFLPALQIYRIKELSGLEHIPRGSPVIYIANHKGRLDGLLLLGTIKKLSAVIKSKYADTPPYSSFVKYLDFISIDPTSLESLSQAIDRSSRTLMKGVSLLIFPEGTRRGSGKMLPFRDFGFKLAVQNRCAIVPVVIHNNLPFMTKSISSYFPERTFTYSIRFLSPVTPLDGESPETLSERVQKLMLRELRELEESS